MAANFTDHSQLGILDLLRVQRQVLVALMLRDIKTRFFGSAWGFLISLGWPLSHILMLLVVNTLIGRLPPYGDSSALWYATGVVPFMAFSYMSRFIMMGIVMNRPLLIFPTVKIMDILMARAIVELLSAGTVILILSIVFAALGISFVPVRVVDALEALGAAFLMGLGLGVINAIIAQALPMWAAVYGLSLLLVWLLSGILFVPENLPQKVQYALSFNPLTHVVLWFRSAYFDGYGLALLDRGYLLAWGAGSLFIGLGLERLVRGRLLQG